MALFCLLFNLVYRIHCNLQSVSHSDFKKSLSIKSSGFEESFCGSELPNNLSLNGIVELRFVSDGSMAMSHRI